MTRQQFLEKLGEILEPEAPLTGGEALKDLESWGSLAAVSFMVLADEACGVQVAPKDFLGCNTVNDLVALVGASLEKPAGLEQP